MNVMRALIVFVVLMLIVCGESNAVTVTNSWAVEIRTGGKAAADALAKKYGFLNKGLVGAAYYDIANQQFELLLQLQVGNFDSVYNFLKMPENSEMEEEHIDDFVYPDADQLTEKLKAELNVRLTVC